MMTSTKSQIFEIRYILPEIDMYSLARFKESVPDQYDIRKLMTISQRRQKMEEALQVKVDEYKDAYGDLSPVKVIAKRFTEKESIERNGLNLAWRDSHPFPCIELHCEWQITYEVPI